MDIFEIISMQRLKKYAESANRVGILGRCAVMVTGRYKVSLMFELESCFQPLLVSANDNKYKISSESSGDGCDKK